MSDNRLYYAIRSNRPFPGKAKGRTNVVRIESDGSEQDYKLFILDLPNQAQGPIKKTTGAKGMFDWLYEFGAKD